MIPMASSCCSCFSSSSSISRSPLLVPLHDRFTDIPEPMRSQMIGACTKIMQDNIMEIANCNRMHGLGWGGTGPRCRACIVELARAVKAAEGARVKVEEEYTSLLAELQLQALKELSSKEQTPCGWRRKRQREREEMEDKEREFKRFCRDSMLAYMTSFQEEEEDDNDDDDDDDDDEGEPEDEEGILEIYD